MFLFNDKKVQRNLVALAKYLSFIVVMILAFAAGFRQLMIDLEGVTYSWVDSLYWTVITMSTLGYGDIVFQSEIGHFYTVVVLMAGIVTLFVVLPFTFIRFFYEPWLESQVRRRTPRSVPGKTKGHVIICAYDELASNLITRLDNERIPYFVIESDPDQATRMYFEGVSVVLGEIDRTETYENLKTERAAMVLVNLEDHEAINTVLTIRETAPDVKVVAVAHHEHSVPVLERAGATHVLPLNRWLGQHLASRVNAGHSHAHVIGSYESLRIAELPVLRTPLVGKTIRETNLRDHTGVSIVRVWERGRLQAATPDTVLHEDSVPVVVGTQEQLNELDFFFSIYDQETEPVVVIGGGDVGRAATRALRDRDVSVVLVERDPQVVRRVQSLCDTVFQGDAMDPAVLREAGIEEAPSVVITTTDDAMNIYLAAQCRRLNPDMLIISRITGEHNVEAIHRAGAVFVLGVSSLGVGKAFSLLMNRDVDVLGEDVDLVSVDVPPALRGKTLAESRIGAEVNLSVIALEEDDRLITTPAADEQLKEGMKLIMLGGQKDYQRFRSLYLPSGGPVRN